MSLSVVNCPKAKRIVSMVTKLDISMVRLLIKKFMVKRDTVSLSVVNCPKAKVINEMVSVVI